MSILYDRISKLCNERNITGYRLCKDVGIQPSIITDLKMGRKEGMSAKNADKIAAYFSVPVSYLLGTDNQELAETEKAPALTKKDERDIAKDMERLRQSLETGDGLMFDGDPLSDEAKESILAAMKMGLEIAKVKNKEKYTPKKYRKETGND